MDKGAESYRRFLDGDDSGLVEMIGEYRQGLILFLNGIVHDLHEAEDITEDTFVRLLVKKPVFSGASSFKTWLYSVARNSAYDHLRHREKEQDFASYGAEEGYSEDDAEAAYIKEERRLLLHSAMKELPPDYRQVLYLIYFEDFDNAGAAKIMKKSKRQIENLIFRAKKALRSKLETEGFVYEDK